MSKLIAVGLRGAYEARDLLLDLDRSDTPDRAENANAILVEAASLTGYPVNGMRNILRMVGYDPYTKFLYESFGNVFTQDNN